MEQGEAVVPLWGFWWLLHSTGPNPNYMGHLWGAVGKGSATGGMAGGLEPSPWGSSSNPRSPEALLASRTHRALGRGRGLLSDALQSPSSFWVAFWAGGWMGDNSVFWGTSRKKVKRHCCILQKYLMKLNAAYSTISPLLSPQMVKATSKQTVTEMRYVCLMRWLRESSIKSTEVPKALSLL